MKRVICLFVVLVLCLGLAVPAFAADNGFVPSITYKPNPEIVPVKDEKGEDAVGVIRSEKGDIADYVDYDCLSVTPIAHVWNPEVEVPAEVEQLLTTVYDGLKEGTMAIPYEKFEGNLNSANMVIRDLFDARWLCQEHGEMVEKEGVTFEITFDLGVVADAQVFAMTYDEATKEWSPIVKTVNNGDGTVTCTFEHLCAVAFFVPAAGSNAPVDETQTFELLPWIVVLMVAVVGFVAVVVIKNKKKAA